MMQIPLSDFEQYIDEKALEHGFHLFENRKVSEIVPHGKGVVEAIVSDGNDYIVELTIKGENLEQYSCTCSELKNPVCKHITAVILEMQQDKLVFEQEIKPKKAKSKKSTTSAISKKESKEVGRPKKFKSATAQAEDILKRVTLSELIEFVREKAKTDRDFRDLMNAHFNYIYEDESRNDYLNIIDAILKSELPKGHLPSRSIGKKIVKLLAPLSDKAKEAFAQSNYLSYFWILTALLERMAPYCIIYYDYECPAILDFTKDILSELNTFSKEVPNQAMRKLVFEYSCENYYQIAMCLSPFGYAVALLAYNTVETDEEARKLLDVTTSKMKSYPNLDPVFVANIHNSNLELINNFYGNEAGEVYIFDHLEIVYLKLLAIDILNKKGEFVKALEIVESFINNNLKARRYDYFDDEVEKFYFMAYNIALKVNSFEKAVDYGTVIVLNKSFDDGKELFAEIKEIVAKNNLNNYISKTVASVKKINSKTNEMLSKFYRHTESWDKLIRLIEQLDSLEIMEFHEPFFPEHFHRDIGELYIRLLTRAFVYSYSYPPIPHLRYIDKVHQYLGYARAISIIEKFKTKFKNNGGMQAELKIIEANINKNKKTFGK